MRYKNNDYSVPTRHGHLQVLVRGYVDEVTIACGSEVIARHPRSYEREVTVYDPLHYLALLELRGTMQIFVRYEKVHGILTCRERPMETVTDSQELVVWAEKGALAEAKDTFSRFEASFRTISSGSSRKDIPASKVSLFYLRDAEPNAEFESILKAFKGHKTSFVVLYTPHHSSDFAFRMGKIVGKHSLDTADWAFNLRHVEQLLRARNVVDRAHKTAERFDIVATRKRLGLTQEQMASALNVTTRTLQNWESGLGTSQMPKKTQDLRELLGLMDDYVIAPKEREWLDTPLPAVQNRRPTDVISSGKLRDLIVEFQRLREGQPV